ncbi:MAG: molybdopterin-synthase adenylyltransferase MoeB [Deltaproteobacteria bacterium]|nr:molybdopterin-synthase adenylyltransferase MoeB [Deltaproteobacteria bacterium]MBW2447449.1 molybdopterin-synthase adenylyltransferase MoeB [Deltaproteobacteria bacterium]
MPDSPPLTAPQYERYRRHLSLPEVGVEGQRRLLDASVLLVGAGGLGSPLALYLAAAGVGRIGLVEFDVVDASNLQRQVLYDTSDVGKPKIERAAERIRAMNPDVQVDLHPFRLNAKNALETLRPYDVVVDGTDNFPTRYLLNDACALLGKPNVHGSIYRFEGQATVFDASRGPCYRCVFPEPPPPELAPSCAEGGVLGVLPGSIALLQATETLKLLAGIGEPLIGRLIQYDALDASFREFRIRKDPACPMCGDAPSITELIDYEGFCGVPQRAEEESPVSTMQVSELKALLDAGGSFLLLDVRNPDEWEVGRIEGAQLLPLPELEARLPELAEWKGGQVVVHCKLGGRSAKACEILLGAGFENVTNVDGGIEAWAAVVDPSVRVGGGE